MSTSSPPNGGLDESPPKEKPFLKSKTTTSEQVDRPERHSERATLTLEGKAVAARLRVESYIAADPFVKANKPSPNAYVEAIEVELCEVGCGRR